MAPSVLDRPLQALSVLIISNITYCCVLQQRSTLTGSTARCAVFSVPRFAKTLLRNIPYRYIFLEKKLPVWTSGTILWSGMVYRHITAHFEHCLTYIWCDSNLTSFISAEVRYCGMYSHRTECSGGVMSLRVALSLETKRKSLRTSSLNMYMLPLVFQFP
jgi:hypothetical protein